MTYNNPNGYTINPTRSPNTVPLQNYPLTQEWWTQPQYQTGPQELTSPEVFDAVREFIETVAGAKTTDEDTLLRLEQLEQMIRCLEEDVNLAKVRLELSRQLVIKKLNAS